jgi:hypothetical protein
VVGTIANIENVLGGSGGAAGTYNILVGNGSNGLTGGNGRRNLLIAGATPSVLMGGNDEDILIGGTTIWDTNPTLWSTALQAIMLEWTQTTPYADRVDHLLHGGGLNGTYVLDPTLSMPPVVNNGGGNTLTGRVPGSPPSTERNLYFGNLSLGDVTDASGDEFYTI